MKKKIGFLLSTCMSVTALPLFAAACKSEQVNPGKQDEVDLNSLFKISLPQNTEKKPSELKPEDIVVKILNNDIKVEIQKVEFKEGKGVLVSYLATNLKTNKIVDEKTITLEVAIKKDGAEPQKEKNYADLITISVNENAKQKTADKVTNDDIKLEVAQGESFKAEVIGVSVQENNSTVIDVKIKITDNETTKELTKTLEVVVEKDEAKPKNNKKYDDLVTISVAEETKKKSADEVTKEEIIITKPDGETFEATVESVSVPKKQLDTVNVKIKIVDGENKKSITKSISGFKEAMPKDVKEGYLIFKDLEIVDTDQAKKWLKEAENGTTVYYDFKTHEFYTKKFDKKNQNDSDRFAILKPKETPELGIETASPDAKQGNNQFKGTAKLVKKENKVGIEFKISKYNGKTKTAKFFDMVEKSNLIDVPEINDTDSAGANSNGTTDTPSTGNSENPQGDQPSAGGTSSSGSENGNESTETPKGDQHSGDNTDSSGGTTGNIGTETPQGGQPSEGDTNTSGGENTGTGTVNPKSDQPSAGSADTSGGTTGNGSTVNPKGEQPGAGGADPSGSETENGSTKNDISKTLVIPELYKPSVEHKLFAISPIANKDNIKKLLDDAISGAGSALRIDAGRINVKSKKNRIDGLGFASELKTVENKINTHGSRGASIGYKFSGGRKGIKVEKKGDNKYQLSWYLITKEGKPTATIFTQELDLS